jgi:hypothetical protein
VIVEKIVMYRNYLDIDDNSNEIEIIFFYIHNNSQNDHHGRNLLDIQLVLILDVCYDLLNKKD